MSYISTSLPLPPVKTSFVASLYETICAWIAINDYAELAPNNEFVVSPHAKDMDICLGTIKKELCQTPCVWKERKCVHLQNF